MNTVCWNVSKQFLQNNNIVISRKRFIKIVKSFGRIGLAYLKVTEIVWQDRLLVNDGHQVVYLKLQAVSLADVIGELNVCLCHFSKKKKKKILQPNALTKIITVTVFVRKNQFANSATSQPPIKHKHMGNSYTS